MILLVSFPRSGNTFFRNVLHEVFGLESKTYLLNTHGPDPGWELAPIVKTHHLPHELPESLLQRKIIYLVRDGRDAVVSFANHRKDIVATESNLETNLWEAIYAEEGSHFGGWSLHVEHWMPKADLVCYFEDLISDPKREFEKLSQLFDLPKAHWERLPTFDQLKFGQPEYGSGKHTHAGSLAPKWFRKGQVGSWKIDMLPEQQMWFWHLHGEAMEHLGYSLEGTLERGNRVDGVNRKMVVLIEATKLLEPFIDGIHRYVKELLGAARRFPHPALEVLAGVGGRAYRLDEITDIAPRLVKKEGLFYYLKQAALQVLPAKTYGVLAQSYQHTVSKFRWRTKTQLEEVQIIDVVLLTLPQHFEWVKMFTSKKVVGVVHDLTHQLFPGYHLPNNIALTASGLDWLQERHADLIAVSGSTASDLAAQGYVSQLVHEGVNRRVFHPILNEHLLSLVKHRYSLPDGDFLLSVATIEPRKNLQRLVDAFCSLPIDIQQSCPLVLTGRKGWKTNIIVPPSSQQFVVFTGFVVDNHLPAIYSLARGFCYVSLYEGFGLPVIEALASGCPVLVSNRSSLPELVGQVGILCDPEDMISIQNGIVTLLALNREKMVTPCMKQSWNFTWRSTWMKTSELLIGNINRRASDSPA